jgi:hypothetical protein
MTLMTQSSGRVHHPWQPGNWVVFEGRMDTFALEGTPACSPTCLTVGCWASVCAVAVRRLARLGLYGRMLCGEQGGLSVRSC